MPKLRQKCLYTGFFWSVFSYIQSKYRKIPEKPSYLHTFHTVLLKLVHSYCQKHNQKTKIESSYSFWEEITSDVLQASILGPLLSTYFYVIFLQASKISTSQIMLTIPLLI